MAKNWVSTEDLSAYRLNELGFKTWMVGILTMTFLRTAIVPQRMVSLDNQAAFHLNFFLKKYG